MSKPIHHILISPLLTEKSVRNAQAKRYTTAEARVKVGAQNPAEVDRMRKDATKAMSLAEAQRKVGGKNAAAVTALKEAGVKKYTFIVATNATKPEIAWAVETLYAKEKVKVADVNTLRVRGKSKRVLGGGSRRGASNKMGMSPAWKKAIVTLTADSPIIEALEGV